MKHERRGNDLTLGQEGSLEVIYSFYKSKYFSFFYHAYRTSCIASYLSRYLCFSQCLSHFFTFYFPFLRRLGAVRPLMPLSCLELDLLLDLSKIQFSLLKNGDNNSCFIVTARLNGIIQVRTVAQYSDHNENIIIASCSVQLLLSLF